MRMRVQRPGRPRVISAPRLLHGTRAWMSAAVCLLAVAAPAFARTPSAAPSLKSTVDGAARPVMARYAIPGMAIAVIADGRTSLFMYGMASLETGKPVTPSTLFEIGSVSKTFTATLAAWAETQGRLSLTDKAGRFLPSLRETPFGSVRLYELGTHTGGGFPLQVPDDVTGMDSLMTYLGQWKPAYEPGARRTYSNVTIGMLGVIAAQSLGGEFQTLMERRLFPALGLRETYVRVPETAMPDYAQGYTKTGTPIRLAESVLSSEAYGIRTTARDLAHFLEANMGSARLDKPLMRAVAATHTGYFRVGKMTQDLVWEQYAYPVALETLIRGNSPAMALEPQPVERLNPPLPPREDVWINKTGSTNGFGAYLAFVPARRLGIVILANKNYPNEARVTIAHQILTRISDASG